MGIWDYINSTTDTLKRNRPDLTPVKSACRISSHYTWSAVTKIDNAVRVNGIQKLTQHLPDGEARSNIEMGIWDYINSTTDTLKRNSPDLTPVKSACRISSHYTWSAVTKIDNAVRVNGIQKLTQHLPDGEARSNIRRFATIAAKNTADYACHQWLKCVPGGVVVYEIGLQSFRDYKKSVNHKEENKAILQPKDKQEKESFGGDVELKSRNVLNSHPNVNKKPEDVIRIFMMKEFMGTHFLDDLIVPGVGSRNKHPKNPK